MNNDHTHDSGENPSKRELIAHIRAQHPELVATAHPLECWKNEEVRQSHGEMHTVRDQGALPLREFNGWREGK